MKLRGRWLVILLGLGACTLPAMKRPDPTPMSHAQLSVGTERFALIFAVSAGEDVEDPDFKAKVAAVEAKGAGPVTVSWLGCQPEYIEVMKGSHRRWVATVGHASLTAQDAWIMEYGVQPIASVVGTIEPCGD